jgi:hypothetical protein
MKLKIRSLNCFLMTPTLTIGLLGCGVPQSNHPIFAMNASGPQPQTCAARASAFDKWMHSLTAESERSFSLPQAQTFDLLVDYGASKPRPWPILELNSFGLSIEGRPFQESLDSIALTAQLSLLKTRLDEQNHPQTHHGDDPSTGISLAIARDVPWRDVVTVTKTLTQVNLTEIDLLFTSPDTLSAKTQPTSSIDPELASLRTVSDPSLKATGHAKLIESVLTSCPEARDRFVELAQLAPNQRLAYLQENFAEAVKQCGCKLELEALKALVFELWGKAASPANYRALPRRFAHEDTPAHVVISQPPDTPWSEAYRELVGAAVARDGHPFLLKNTPSKTGQSDPTIVLRITFTKPINESARNFLRITGTTLYHSTSTGAFYAKVGEQELKNSFGLEVAVTVVAGAGNSAHTNAKFVKFKHPEALNSKLRSLISKIEVEDDPKFELTSDAIEYREETNHGS